MGQDIFSLSLLVQVFFLFRIAHPRTQGLFGIALQEISFQNHPPPPPPQKLNGRPLTIHNNARAAIFLNQENCHKRFVFLPKPIKIRI
jgi:hypothetical protein